MAFKYPDIHRDENIKDNYHGFDIEDPYRWMENIEIDRTRTFIDSQNVMIKSYLKPIKYRANLKKNLTDMCKLPKFEVPRKEGNKFFQFRNTGLQNIDVLYYGTTLELLGVHRNIFFDPNLEIPDEDVTLPDVKFSKNGKIMAILLNYDERDETQIIFKNADNFKNYSECIRNSINNKIEWFGDEGIFYSAFVEEESRTDVDLFKSQNLLYHKIGTKVAEDVIVFSVGGGYGELYAKISYCGKYLLIFHNVRNNGTAVYYSNLIANEPIVGKLPVLPVIEGHEAFFEYITNDDSFFLFRTNKDAPHMRLIKLDIKRSDKPWDTLVPEHYIEFLEACIPVKENRIVILSRQNARHVVRVHNLTNGDEIMELPIEIGAIVSMSGQRHHTEIFLKFQSMVIPGIIYRVNFALPNVEIDVFQQVRLKFAENFEMRQVQYKSKDGTEIIMYILHKKGLVKNGLNPCLLCSYGDRNEHVYPKFSIVGVTFVNNFNGVYAVANIRGGGHHGEKWFMAGTVENKEKSFEDFQCAAKFLFLEKYTSPQRLAIYGNSRGGLLVGVCVNQTPELFGAAIIENADLDMLRHNDHTYSNTRVSDYGHPHNPHHFHFLRQFSPLHNIRVPKKKIPYPAVLVFVDNIKNKYKSSQSFKFIATLQHVLGKLPQQKNPLMIRVDNTSSSNKPLIVVVNEWLDLFCFLGKSLDLHYDEHPHKKKVQIQ